MADLSWPAQMLPDGVLAAGYRFEQDPGLIRTPMDTGLARQRKRFSTPPIKVPVAWTMTGAEVEFFRAWLEHKAGFGAAFFNVDLRLDQGRRSVEARFMGAVQYAQLAPDLWRVSSELEVKAPAALSADVVDLLLIIRVDDAVALAAALDGVTIAPALAVWHDHYGV